MVGGSVEGGGGGVIAVVFLIYGCGAFLEGRRSWLGLGISLALVAGISLVKSSVLPVLFDDVAFALLPFLVGRARRLGRARELAERERAERLDSERELRVRTAALSERTRLAREIHDVIAHSVSVMVIQAAGARTVMESDPARAESALRSVERAGREALAEMRRLLGVLGDGEHLRELAPQPGLEDLPELVSSTRVAGLHASILVEGDPVAVSQGLSLCAYRVVQEALTNTLKHAGPTRAEVRLRWREDALELLVSRRRTRRRTRCRRAARRLVGARDHRDARARGAARRVGRGRGRLRRRVRRPRDDPPGRWERDVRARTRFASRIDPTWVDVAVAAALMVDLILEATLGSGLPDRLATALFAILFAAPVAVRRRWPAGAVIACTVVGLLEDAFDGQLFNLPSHSA